MKIYNAHILTMEIENYDGGFIAFEHGKITAVGFMASMPPPEAGDLDAGGGYVIPGYIDGHNHSGLDLWDITESADPFTPEIEIANSINTSNPTFWAATRSGVTSGLICPGSYNLMGGQTALMKFHGGADVRDCTVKAPCSMKAAFGTEPNEIYGRGKRLSPYTRMGSYALMRDMLLRAARYMEKKEAGGIGEPDVKLEAVLPVLKREIAMHFHAMRSDDIMSAIRVCREFNVRCAIIHATGGHLVADCIREAGAKVIAGPILFPNCMTDMAEGNPYNTAALYKAGVDMCFGTDAWAIRGDDLAASAAVSVSQGMGEMDALKMLTINAARILDADARIGSLKPGKDADIAVFDRFPLSYGSHVLATYIDGIRVY